MQTQRDVHLERALCLHGRKEGVCNVIHHNHKMCIGSWNRYYTHATESHSHGTHGGVRDQCM